MGHGGHKYFPVGGPVSPDDVVDRELFLEGLVRRLGDGQSVLLAGPRRIGKTSLACECFRRLRQAGYYTAMVDVFAVSSKKDLAERLADAMLENRSGLKRTVHKLQEMVRGAIKNVEVKGAVQDLEIALAFQRPDITEEDLLEQVLDLGENLAQRDGKGMIIAFDEFQDMSKLGGPEIFKKLRAYFQRHQHVSYLFLGSHTGVLREIFGEGRQAFYRFAVPLDVPSIPKDAWVEYITRKFGNRGIRLEPGSVDQMLPLTGGHPQDTMMVCAEVYFALLEAGATIVTADVVTVGYERALYELSRAFDEIWYAMATRRQAQAVAKRLAAGKRPYAEGTHPNEVARAIDLLAEMGVLQKKGRGEYDFVEPMLADYVRRL